MYSDVLLQIEEAMAKNVKDVGVHKNAQEWKGARKSYREAQ